VFIRQRQRERQEQEMPAHAGRRRGLHGEVNTNAGSQPAATVGPQPPHRSVLGPYPAWRPRPPELNRPSRPRGARDAQTACPQQAER
jgi:hypothetical protein